MNSDVEIHLTEVENLNRELKDFKIETAVKLEALRIKMLMVAIFGIAMPFIFVVVLLAFFSQK